MVQPINLGFTLVREIAEKPGRQRIEDLTGETPRLGRLLPQSDRIVGHDEMRPAPDRVFLRLSYHYEILWIAAGSDGLAET